MQEYSAEHIPLVPENKPMVFDAGICALGEDPPRPIEELHLDGYEFWNGIEFSRTRSVQGDVTMLKLCEGAKWRMLEYFCHWRITLFWYLHIQL
jgi:hypothetical protein